MTLQHSFSREYFLWNSPCSQGGSHTHSLCNLLFFTLTPSSKQISQKSICHSYADESGSALLWDIFHILVSLNWLLSGYPYKLHVDKKISQHSPFKRQRKSFFSVKMDNQQIRPANLDYNTSVIFDSYFSSRINPKSQRFFRHSLSNK